jgi:hypothetical protein
MKVAQEITSTAKARKSLPLPPGPKGHFILGVMREFNNDTLGFMSRCRDFGDVVRARFLTFTLLSLTLPTSKPC